MRGLPESHLRDFAAYVRRAPPSHDLSWPSAGALARIACCGRPRSASRAAQPSSSAARAVFFAIGSWTLYGDAAGRIKASVSPYIVWLWLDNTTSRIDAVPAAVVLGTSLDI